MSLRTISLAAGVCAVTGLVLGVLGAADPAGATGPNSIAAPDTTGDVGHYTSLALDAANNPVVSYYDIANNDLKVVHCNDANCAGSNESVTAPDTSSFVGPDTSLALDGADNPVASYRGPSFDLKVLHCNDLNCDGSGESITTPDTGGDVGYWTSLALDATGNPVVSYHDGGPNGDLKVLHCDDANCAGGGETITAPDTSGFVGLYTSLRLDGANPVVSYYDLINGDLKVLHCNDANCAGGGESVTSPDTGGSVGLYTSLALDASGNPVVSYQDGTNGDLKVLHCDDANCAGGGESVTSPDTGGLVGYYTSLALDASGNPVISYYDVTNHDLKVLHCDDPNCDGGGESFVAADTLGDVGAWTSLELDNNGNPVVSYYDQTNGDLKLLHCVTVTCAPKPPTPTPTKQPPPGDTDGDGCSDQDENGTDEEQGGRRDYLNPYDFYDIDANKLIDLFTDIFGVANAFGDDADSLPPGEPDGYDATLDRSAPLMGEDVWDMHAPDGIIDLFNDIFGVAFQFGHDCS